METLSLLMDGFAVAGTPENLMIALIGCFIGTVVGLLPGLGPINGVAILLPIAFAMKLPPESALILLCAVYAGCEYGGRISAILINVPGDAGAVMTTLDGYPMAKKGLAGPALSMSALASFTGALLATIGIVAFAPLLAEWAIAFGPAEHELFTVLQGRCRVHADDGSFEEAGPGEALFVPPGFSGSFEVLETLTKTYAIVDGDAPAA